MLIRGQPSYRSPPLLEATSTPVSLIPLSLPLNTLRISFIYLYIRMYLLTRLGLFASRLLRLLGLLSRLIRLKILFIIILLKTNLRSFSKHCLVYDHIIFITIIVLIYY